MKTIRKQIIKILIFPLFLFSCISVAQTQITPYRPGITTEGITYFLPKTQLHIILRADKETYLPGEYATFARRFLGIENVGTKKTEKWTLRSVEVIPFGSADKSKSYTIALNHKTSAPLVSLAPDGRLLGINTKVAPLPPLEKGTITQIQKPRNNAHRFKTQEVIRAGNLTAKAETTAQEIYDIRENRTLLAKGQADFNPKDGEQLRLMLARLDEQEEALTSLFIGTTNKEAYSFVFEYIPQKEVVREELFRFSKHLGLLETDDLAGYPIYISIEDKRTLPAEEEAPRKKKKEEEDLRYCNPSSALVKIFTSERTLYEESIPIAQFGRIEHLGGVLFNKKFNTRVTLSPITGSIENIDLEQLDK